MVAWDMNIILGFLRGKTAGKHGSLQVREILEILFKSQTFNRPSFHGNERAAILINLTFPKPSFL
jgi:hypothetical protein